MRNIEILTLLPIIRFEREKNETLYLNSRKSGQVAHRLDGCDMLTSSDTGPERTCLRFGDCPYCQNLRWIGVARPGYQSFRHAQETAHVHNGLAVRREGQYQTLHELHPITGFVFIVILGLAIIWIIGYYLITLTSRPAVLRPPKIAVLSCPTNRELHRYGKYLVKYISRFTNNDAFTVAERDLARPPYPTLPPAMKERQNISIYMPILPCYTD